MVLVVIKFHALLGFGLCISFSNFSLKFYLFGLQNFQLVLFSCLFIDQGRYWFLHLLSCEHHGVGKESVAVIDLIFWQLRDFILVNVLVAGLENLVVLTMRAQEIE